jgi:FtsZ-interacting cell division protein ZipA
MDTWIWILIIVVAIVALVAVGLWFAQKMRRRRALRGRFGPEYDRSVESARSRRKAEGELAERAEQREQLDIRPLPADSRQRYVTRWNEVERRFVDRPEVAVVEADDLVTQVMSERGYPVENFESQSKLISVDHPEVVEKYRAAHGVFTRTTSGEATTEELRRAVVAYRELFEEISH